MARKWWTLLAVCVATFMLLLDITVVNVALPDIQKSLGASLSSLQWVVDAYSLTLAAFLLTAGSLADRIGRRRVFAVGFLIFTIASFLCGISPNATIETPAKAGLRKSDRSSIALRLRIWMPTNATSSTTAAISDPRI